MKKASKAEQTLAGLAGEARKLQQAIDALVAQKAVLQGQIDILTDTRDRMEDAISEAVRKRKLASEGAAGGRSPRP